MFQIVMSGIASVSSMRILERGLKRDYNRTSTLDFFCLYSEYEILVGSTFKTFRSFKTDLSIKVNAKLIDVTQQWGLPYDRIPLGHRTLARIEFEDEESVFAIKREMPVIYRWEDGDYNFALIE